MSAVQVPERIGGRQSIAAEVNKGAIGAGGDAADRVQSGRKLITIGTRNHPALCLQSLGEGCIKSAPCRAR